MSKFKVGDRIRAIDDKYGITCASVQWEGVATYTDKNGKFSAQTEQSQLNGFEGKEFFGLHEDHFELIQPEETEENMEAERITINGIDYVRADSVKEKAADLNGMEYRMVRTFSAGVFAGYIESRIGKEAVLRNARRIWYWDGAASLSQLATDGTSKPDKCKFPCEVDKVILTEVIEIIPMTAKAQKSIKEVEEWKM